MYPENDLDKLNLLIIHGLFISFFPRFDRKHPKDIEHRLHSDSNRPISSFHKTSATFDICSHFEKWTVTCGIRTQNLTRKGVLMSVYFFEVDFVSSIAVYQTLVQRNHG